MSPFEVLVSTAWIDSSDPAGKLSNAPLDFLRPPWTRTSRPHPGEGVKEQPRAVDTRRMTRFGGTGVISLLVGAVLVAILWQYGVGGGHSGAASQPAQDIAQAENATGEANL